MSALSRSEITGLRGWRGGRWEEGAEGQLRTTSEAGGEEKGRSEQPEDEAAGGLDCTNELDEKGPAAWDYGHALQQQQQQQQRDLSPRQVNPCGSEDRVKPFIISQWARPNGGGGNSPSLAPRACLLLLTSMRCAPGPPPVSWPGGQPPCRAPSEGKPTAARHHHLLARPRWGIPPFGCISGSVHNVPAGLYRLCPRAFCNYACPHTPRHVHKGGVLPQRRESLLSFPMFFTVSGCQSQATPALFQAKTHVLCMTPKYGGRGSLSGLPNAPSNRQRNSHTLLFSRAKHTRMTRQNHPKVSRAFKRVLVGHIRQRTLTMSFHRFS